MKNKSPEQDYARIYLVIDLDVVEAVSRIAKKERRSWKDQAYILLRQKLEEMGALSKNENDKDDE